MSYEGLDKKEELETVPLAIDNNIVNVVSDSNSDSSKDDFKNDDDNFFGKDIDDQVKAAPPNHYQCKSGMSYEKLEALYDDNANKNIKQATQEEVPSKI